MYKTVHDSFITLKKQFMLMKNAHWVLIALFLFTMSGCSVIEGIFKAGAIVGIIAVVVVILVLIWIISLFRGKP